MKQSKSEDSSNEMRKEYDFRGGVRGKHAKQYAVGANVVVLDPDVASAFPNAEAVNEALRTLAHQTDPDSAQSASSSEA